MMALKNTTTANEHTTTLKRFSLPNNSILIFSILLERSGKDNSKRITKVATNKITTINVLAFIFSPDIKVSSLCTKNARCQNVVSKTQDGILCFLVQYVIFYKNSEICFCARSISSGVVICNHALAR